MWFGQPSTHSCLDPGKCWSSVESLPGRQTLPLTCAFSFSQHSWANFQFLGGHCFHNKIERHMGFFKMSSEFLSSFWQHQPHFGLRSHNISRLPQFPCLPFTHFYSRVPQPQLYMNYLHRNILLESQTRWGRVVRLLSCLLNFLSYQLSREVMVKAFISVVDFCTSFYIHKYYFYTIYFINYYKVK